MTASVQPVHRVLESVELLEGTDTFPVAELGMVLLASMHPRIRFERLDEATQASYRRQGYRLASLLAARGFAITRVAAPAAARIAAPEAEFDPNFQQDDSK